MRIIISTILTLSFFLAGCGRVSESTLSDILEKDPSFQKILDAKKRINARILSLRQEMEPNIEALKEKLEKAQSEYKIKKKAFKDTLHKSKNIKKLLAKKEELTLSGDEVSIWNKRAANLQKEIDALKKGLDELQNKTRLLKAEIKILQK